MEWFIQGARQRFLDCWLPILLWNTGICWGTLASPCLEMLLTVLLAAFEGAGMGATDFGGMKATVCPYSACGRMLFS